MKKGGLESRILELDGIRGMAILMVVCFHFLEVSTEGGGWFQVVARSILSFGWTGVDLFFVLSGFLIGGIVIDNADAENRFRIFYTRRVCRIFPLYFLWLALFYVLPSFLPAGFPGHSVFDGEIFHFPRWGYVFFLQNFYTAMTGNFGSMWMGVTWSLAVEEQFYFLLPAAIWFARPRKAIQGLIVLIALVPLFRVFLFLFRPQIFIYVLLPCRADALLIGVLCAYLIRRKGVYDWLSHNTKALNRIFTFLLTGVVYLVFLGRGRTSRGIFDLFEMAAFGFTLIALFWACLLLIAIFNKASVVSVLSRIPQLRHLGIVSYGIYITHRPIGAAIQDLVFGGRGGTILSRNLISILAFFVTWSVAALSWHFFERPIVQLGQSFRYLHEQKNEKYSPSTNAN